MMYANSMRALGRILSEYRLIVYFSEIPVLSHHLIG